MAALLTRPIGVLEPENPEILYKPNLYVGVEGNNLKVVDLGNLSMRNVLNRVYGSVAIESSTAAIFSSDVGLQGGIFLIWNADIGREYQLRAEVLSLSLLKGSEEIMVMRDGNILFYYNPFDNRLYESPDLKKTIVLPKPISESLYFSDTKAEFLSMLRTIGNDKYSKEISKVVARGF